jgi:hypothetical protein
MSRELHLEEVWIEEHIAELVAKGKQSDPFQHHKNLKESCDPYTCINVCRQLYGDDSNFK